VVERKKMASTPGDAADGLQECKDVTKRLNRVYRERSDPDEQSLGARMKQKFRSIIKDRW
jgi:hypothetical protein